MERPADDVSWHEIGSRLRVILATSGLLIAAELLYRWVTYPEDFFSYYQEFITWVWYNFHSLLFGSETITLSTKNGLNTVVTFHHPDFVGSSISPLWVSDECVGLHEIAFVSFLIAMTPGVTKSEKMKGISVMAIILFTLNMARLLVLYPLAVRGCADAAGQYGCWAGMWEFHEFMLSVGFMLVIILGWLGWFLAIRGAEKVHSAEKLFPDIPPPSHWGVRRTLSKGRVALISISLLVVLASANTLFFDEEARVEKLQADGCEGVISALCAEEIREWDNISGKAWRGALIGLTVAGYSLVRISPEKGDGEEE